MALTLDGIEELFARKGGEQYRGEPVTQLQHALQTAAQAAAEGADDALVAAALLHDIGHLLHDFGESPTVRGIDDLHQYRALPFLRGLLPTATLDAIALHVDAKRYLCAVQPGYFDSLSDDSQRSLQLQGGAFAIPEAEAFATKPGAANAVRLRVWDDLAKSATAQTPPLAHFMARVRRCVDARRTGA